MLISDVDAYRVGAVGSIVRQPRDTVRLHMVIGGHDFGGELVRVVAEQKSVVICYAVRIFFAETLMIGVYIADGEGEHCDDRWSIHVDCVCVDECGDVEESKGVRNRRKWDISTLIVRKQCIPACAVWEAGWSKVSIPTESALNPFLDILRRCRGPAGNACRQASHWTTDDPRSGQDLSRATAPTRDALLHSATGAVP